MSNKIRFNQDLLEIANKICPEQAPAIVYSIMTHLSYDEMLMNRELGKLPEGITLYYSRTGFYRYRKKVLSTYRSIILQGG